MGTRLYPNTEDPELLELLAGVPKGTASMYEIIDAACSDPVCYKYDSLYAFLDLDPQVDQFYNFLLFGWGKLREPVYELATRLEWYRRDELMRWHFEVDRVTDVELTYHVLELQGVSAQVLQRLAGRPLGCLGGLHWS